MPLYNRYFNGIFYFSKTVETVTSEEDEAEKKRRAQSAWKTTKKIGKLEFAGKSKSPGVLDAIMGAAGEKKIAQKKGKKSAAALMGTSKAKRLFRGKVDERK